MSSRTVTEARSSRIAAQDTHPLGTRRRSAAGTGCRCSAGTGWNTCAPAAAVSPALTPQRDWHLIDRSGSKMLRRQLGRVMQVSVPMLGLPMCHSPGDTKIVEARAPAAAGLHESSPPGRRWRAGRRRQAAQHPWTAAEPPAPRQRAASHRVHGYNAVLARPQQQSVEPCPRERLISTRSSFTNVLNPRHSGTRVTLRTGFKPPHSHPTGETTLEPSRHRRHLIRVSSRGFKRG